MSESDAFSAEPSSKPSPDLVRAHPTELWMRALDVVEIVRRMTDPTASVAEADREEESLKYECGTLAEYAKRNRPKNPAPTGSVLASYQMDDKNVIARKICIMTQWAADMLAEDGSPMFPVLRSVLQGTCELHPGLARAFAGEFTPVNVPLLHVAAMSGKLDTVKYALNELRAHPLELDSAGMTASDYAIAQQEIHVVVYLYMRAYREVARMPFGHILLDGMRLVSIMRTPAHREMHQKAFDDMFGAVEAAINEAAEKTNLVVDLKKGSENSLEWFSARLDVRDTDIVEIRSDVDKFVDILQKKLAAYKNSTQKRTSRRTRDFGLGKSS